jgi:hypothetical protein
MLMPAQHALAVEVTPPFSTRRVETMQNAEKSIVDHAERVRQAREALVGILGCAYADRPRWLAVNSKVESVFAWLSASLPLTGPNVSEARERVYEGVRLAFQQTDDWEDIRKRIFKVFGDRGLSRYAE